MLSSHLRACSEEVNNSNQRQHSLISGSKVENTKFFIIKTENKHMKHKATHIVNEVNELRKEIMTLKEERKHIENETKQVKDDVDFEKKMITKVKNDINEAQT